MRNWRTGCGRSGGLPTGGVNRGTPAFFGFGMTAQKVGMNIQELEVGEMKDGPDAAICMAFRIQPIILGAVVGMRHGSQYGGTMKEAHQALADFTLVPLWRALASEFQSDLVGEPGYPKAKVRFDLAQVRALQESEKDREERLGSMFDRGGITRAEYRHGMGYPTEPVDEVFKESLAIVWVRRDQMRELNPGLMEAEADRRSSTGSDTEGDEPPSIPPEEGDDEEDEEGMKGHPPRSPLKGGGVVGGSRRKYDVARLEAMARGQQVIRERLIEQLEVQVEVAFQEMGRRVEERLESQPPLDPP